MHLHTYFFTGEIMTKDEALQMCLEYIETDAHERKYVRHAIKAALEAKDEPYALEASMFSNDRVKVDPVTGNVSIGTPQRTLVGLTDEKVWEKVDMREHAEGNLGIGTAPPSQRTWVGLTDEEMEAAIPFGNLSGEYSYDDILNIILLIQAKLRRKNYD